MFLVEEKSNGQRRALIYLLPDGRFEGRIYKPRSNGDRNSSKQSSRDFEICGAETLPRIKELVDEELGL